MDFTKHSEGTTSVKVHHQPGGQSSFSIGHDDTQDDRWGNSGKIGQGSTSQPKGAAGAKPKAVARSPFAMDDDPPVEEAK